MGVLVNGVVLQDDVDVVVDVCSGPLHISDGVANILGGNEVVSVHNGSRGKIINYPVVVVLPIIDRVS